MDTPFRRAALAALLTASALLAACGADVAPSADGATRSVDPAVAEAQRVAYNEAICPLFTAIVDLDPRLASLREIGASGDLSGATAELDAVAASMLSVLDALNAVPQWGPGTELRFTLIDSIHVIRTQLLVVREEPGTAASADLLASLPFMATDAMERSMQRAIEGGLDCEGID